jgi:hypothetical protein
VGEGQVFIELEGHRGSGREPDLDFGMILTGVGKAVVLGGPRFSRVASLRVRG